VTVTAIQVGHVMRGVPAYEQRAAISSSQMSELTPYQHGDVRRD
jgi:hypothetical protein